MLSYQKLVCKDCGYRDWEEKFPTISYIVICPNCHGNHVVIDHAGDCHICHKIPKTRDSNLCQECMEKLERRTARH